MEGVEVQRGSRPSGALRENPFRDVWVVVKGGGDLATGVAHRLWRSGFPVVITETAAPTMVRRTVSFAEAVYAGETSVEGVVARRVEAEDPGAAAEEARALVADGILPVVVDPETRVVAVLRPTAVVDAIMAKRNLNTRMGDAPVVVALGPGFQAGRDAHAVVETARGHDLGRVITRGRAQPDTGRPGPIAGYSEERLLRAPAAGTFEPLVEIGDRVDKGEPVARVDGASLAAPIAGVVRGLLHGGLPVKAGLKVGDIDPRGDRTYCYAISDKSRAIAGGVLEAILSSLLGARPRGGEA